MRGGDLFVPLGARLLRRGVGRVGAGLGLVGSAPRGLRLAARLLGVLGRFGDRAVQQFGEHASALLERGECPAELCRLATQRSGGREPGGLGLAPGLVARGVVRGAAVLGVAAYAAGDRSAAVLAGAALGDRVGGQVVVGHRAVRRQPSVSRRQQART
ncbi:hypothetical protein GCM10010402_59990 [Actinomadura luteofluorescens]|uniref:hypothetical protein n=1 Tax=Actinomadura luteofluorescens TaxID=46163 RepID=UPI00216491C4|nr:hypothetical protein [Actinomadura glauciflava]